MISRLKEFGSEGFQSHELLEMMLYSSFKQCDTNPIAHRLIDRFGTLSGVFSVHSIIVSDSYRPLLSSISPQGCVPKYTAFAEQY